MIKFGQYERLLNDRPFKFTPQQVGYEEGEGEYHCVSCAHFFLRPIDRHTVCEIMRSPDIDREGVNPQWVCQYYTADGGSFPLLSNKAVDDKQIELPMEPSDDQD